MELSRQGGRGVTKRRTIRHKLLIAVIVLSAVIGALGYSSFRGAYAYRDLAVILSQRASELPATAELTRAVDDLQTISLRTSQAESSADQASTTSSPTILMVEYDLWAEHRNFSFQLDKVRTSLALYSHRLASSLLYDPLLSDRTEEQEMVVEIEKLLTRISDRNNSRVLILSVEQSEEQKQDLQKLSDLTHQLPTFLYDRMSTFRDEVRTRYRTWIGISLSSILFTAILLVGLCIYVRVAVIIPFKSLLEGSRLVASGNFRYRIEIESNDELSELAAAINMGTESFLRILRCALGSRWSSGLALRKPTAISARR